MNRLTTETRVRILTMLSEGMGVNATCWATGASKNTVLKLLADVGSACQLYQERTMCGLTIEQVQVDEIWSFIGCKAKNVPADADPTLGLGDCYTFTAIDPITKLMPCWMLGFRTNESADHFMADLKKCIKTGHRIQLTTDGMSGYPAAVAKHFGKDIDYVVLNKTYSTPVPAKEAKRRYSPNEVTGISLSVVTGAPDLTQASTSHVERANLTMRMSMRRFTRLTNAFSKKIENHMHAVSFFFMVYNFVKVHGTIKTTPAIKAGVATFKWTMEDILLMTETAEAA